MKNTNTNFISTEIDLDRDVPDYIEGDFDVDVDENGPFITASFDDQEDMPGFEGTMESLEDLVDSVVGEPEFLGVK